MIVGEVFLAILFRYDGDESEVVAPHKKSQVINVSMSEEGAMRQRLVEKRRRKFADIVLAVLFGYNGSKARSILVEGKRKEFESKLTGATAVKPRARLPIFW